MFLGDAKNPYLLPPVSSSVDYSAQYQSTPSPVDGNQGVPKYRLFYCSKQVYLEVLKFTIPRTAVG